MNNFPLAESAAHALDIQYDARASVPCFDDEYRNLVDSSRRVTSNYPCHAGLVYDSVSAQTLDFYSAGELAPLFVWIHGGYWRGGSAADNAFVVPGLFAHGYSVAVLDYTLAPVVSLDEIVRQVRTAISFLHHSRGHLEINGDAFVVGGTSAGGHLTAMLLSDSWQHDFALPRDIVDVAVVLSGLHDLTPLLQTKVNSWLNLSQSMAVRNSPQFLIPKVSSAHLVASVGGLETAAFRRQTADYVTAWRQAGHAATVVEMPQSNHFNLPLALGDAEGELVRVILKAREFKALKHLSGSGDDRLSSAQFDD